MTARPARHGVKLAGEQAEVIHAALTACCQVLYWAARHGDPQFRAALDHATQAAAGGLTPGRLRYDLTLAIDYLDFAPAATATRRKR